MITLKIHSQIKIITMTGINLISTTGQFQRQILLTTKGSHI